MPISLNGTTGAITGMVSASSTDLSTALNAKLNTPGAWNSITPTVAGGWAIGNGTATTRFIQIGKTVNFTTTITFGSTSTFGGGWMSVSLPVTPLDNGSVTGIAYANDLSTGANYIGALVSGVYPLWITSSGGSLDGTISTRPMTWASGDILRILATYEAA